MFLFAQVVPGMEVRYNRGRENGEKGKERENRWNR